LALPRAGRTQRTLRRIDEQAAKAEKAVTGIAVIGVAKSRFRTAAHAVPVVRDPRDTRCLSPRQGCPQPTRRA
jgi:hypothetical protein